MSYNGYNQYSPYWQQTAGQANPQSAGQIGQPKNPYQPLSAFQNNQQPSHSSTSQPAGNSSGASYGSPGYVDLNMNGAGAGNGRSQDSRPAYTNTNDRASIDGATALGNLAYASSLGRDGSMQQVPSYNRQQNHANYGTTNPYGVNSAPPIQYRTGDERRNSSDSSREANASSQQATASPSFGYSSNNVGYQGPSASSNTQGQTQYSQPSRSSTEQYRQNQYSQPLRPPSSQAIQGLGSQAAPSPTISANQNTPNLAQISGTSSSVRVQEQARVQTPQSDARPSSSQLSRGPTPKSQASKTSHDNTTNQSAKSSTKSKAKALASAKETVAKRINEVSQSSAVDSKSAQASKPATPVEPQYTTVDPSQVFNHIEYSRRQAAAAAEAAAVKKTAREAEVARIAATQPKPASPQINEKSASDTEPNLATKDQIELEMKQMIEKMRDYKAKDPSLFTQIWEQVKKGQPPQRAPSQSLRGSATSPIVINGQLPSPNMIQNQLPPESDLPAGDEFPPDFDRGRFPAQRRKRGGSMRVSAGRKSGTPKGSTEPTAENQRSPVPPEIAIPAPQVGQIFPDPGSQSMQQAMHQFHQNSRSPVPKAQQNPPFKKNEKTDQVRSNTPAPPSGPTSSMTPPSGPQSAQPAQPPKAGGTYWPESKKTALAEAAQVALTSTQPNQGKNITTQEIHELLDQNPSYTQMCEILEYRGFVIDRGQFARILLKAVPDLGSASSSTNAARATPTNAPSTNNPLINATPVVPASNNSPKTVSSTPTAGSFGKLVKAASSGSAPKTNIAQPLPYLVPPMGTLHAPDGYVTPYVPKTSVAEQTNGSNNGLPRDYRFVDPTYSTPGEQRHDASITNQGRPNGSTLQSHPSLTSYQQPFTTNPTKQALDQNESIQPNGVTPQHPTKQEMARKRTFGEIVDLTQGLSDDEELERHRPRPRFVDDWNAPGPSKSVKNVFNQVARRQPNSGTTTPKPFKYKYSGRDALLLSYDIVEPMNKRRDALRRSTYNPKTIARDVLLGLGKHPTMAPLNAHLDILKDRFKAVDYESDLSTFRWDLVDPEGKVNVQSSDTDDEQTVHAVAAVPRQRPAPTAVMINNDGGIVTKDDQPPSRTVNSQGKPYKRGPYKKSGIRSGIQPIGSADTLERQSSQSSPHAQDISLASNINPPDLSQFAYNGPYTTQMDAAKPDTTSESAKKRKGRPRGAKNKQARPDKGIPKKIKTSSVGETPSLAKIPPIREKPPVEGIIAEKKRAKKEGSVGKTPPVGTYSVGKPSSTKPSIPNRPRPVATTPVKPSGLRNSISAITPIDGIAVVISSRSPSVVALTPEAFARKSKLKKTEAASNATLYAIARKTKTVSLDV
ncbi:MAG: hypothetical protein ASARMPREDX12_005267 [Alectoria sarmentosa]|nr:MAG: hypothetical protein ASARMPREDX12_005267 [Alectoria sarmentosa]